MIKIYLITFLLAYACSKLYQSAILFRHGARYNVYDVYDGNSTKALEG